MISGLGVSQQPDALAEDASASKIGPQAYSRDRNEAAGQVDRLGRRGAGDKRGAARKKDEQKAQAKAERQSLYKQLVKQQEKVQWLRSNLAKLLDTKKRNTGYDLHIAAQATKRIETLNVELDAAVAQLEALRKNSNNSSKTSRQKHIF